MRKHSRNRKDNRPVTSIPVTEKADQPSVPKRPDQEADAPYQEEKQALRLGFHILGCHIIRINLAADKEEAEDQPMYDNPDIIEPLQAGFRPDIERRIPDHEGDHTEDQGILNPGLDQDRSGND